MFCGKRRIIKSFCSCIPLFTGLSLGICMDSRVIQNVSNSVNAGSIWLTKRKWQQLSCILQALILVTELVFSWFYAFVFKKLIIPIFFLLWTFHSFHKTMLMLVSNPDFTLKWVQWYKYPLKQHIKCCPYPVSCIAHTCKHL